MATAGLSLVGFMDQPQAMKHLTTACIPANPSPQALQAEWNTAKAKLGVAIANAGKPDITSIPAADAAYIQQLQNIPWVATYLATTPGATFQLVEIDPLLAYQFAVDTARSDHHCGVLQKPPTVTELLPVLLPTVLPSGEYHFEQQSQSVVIKSRSLNLQMTAWGIGPNMAGINFGWSIPLVHVVRFNGRCYLHNGFHRAFGARLAGATHVPCLLRDVTTAEAANIRDDGSTFTLPLLESANPPTLGHFSQGRAHGVTLKATTRILHVSWASYAMYDDD